MRPKEFYTTTLGGRVSLGDVDYVTGIKRIEETRPGGYFVYRAEYSIVYKDGRKSLVSRRQKKFGQHASKDYKNKGRNK